MSDPTSLSDAALAFDVANLRKRLATAWADGLDAAEVHLMQWRLRVLGQEQRRRDRMAVDAAGRRLEELRSTRRCAR